MFDEDTRTSSVATSFVGTVDPSVILLTRKMCCDGLIGRLPQLNSCCCGCSLETGSKIIAWLEIIVSVVAVFGGVSSLVAGAIIPGVVFVIVTVFIFSMALILLLGLYREETSKVECWLRFNCFFFFMYVLLAILDVVAAIVTLNIAAIVGTVIGALLGIVYRLYIISVVKSHCNNMMNGSGDGRV
ncbi:hypothetical protein GE061_012599 [Apolygus lucorum]|uniref:MARVEL domain-containing protein n=1 Tax=Apolygus lucorum TaxID=248454 RepID=A0A8S9XU26_APOLU|nr:hypothetical protein GE061_012599 [Apolygus lucorum]